MRRRAPETGEAGLRHLDRHDIWLWSITLVLVLVQAIAILVLYWPEVRGQWDSGYVVAETKGTLATGLCGLIVIFCLYILNKQSQMRRLRVRLAAERIRREALSSRLEELTALFEVATRMNPKIPVDAFLQAVVERLVRAVQVSGGCAFWRRSLGEPVACLAACGAHGLGTDGRAAFPAGPPLDAVLEERAVLRGPAKVLFGERGPFPSDAHLLALPLGQGERSGVLLLVRRPHPFQADEESLLRLFGERLSQDIERLAHVEQLEARATSLEATHLRLTEREREEWRFFSSLHREIRQSLATIAYRVEACESGMGVRSEETLAEHVPALAEQVRKLAAAVQEASVLLDIDPLSEKLRIEPAELNAVVEGAVARVALLAGSRGVAVESRLAADLPPAVTDAKRFGRALTFYLSEIVRRTSEGGSLRLTTAPEAEGSAGPRVRLEIVRQVERERRSEPSGPTLSGLLLREVVEGLGGSAREIEADHAIGIRLWVVAADRPERPAGVAADTVPVETAREAA